MTVIVALKDIENNRIFLGCDGQGTSGEIKVKWNNHNGKIVDLKIPITSTNDDDCEDISSFDDMYIGVSGSHYLQSYLTHAFHPPCKRENEDFVDYLYNQFFQKLNNELTEHLLLKSNDGALESEAGLIIIYKNEIYDVYSDFSIVKNDNLFSCQGSGWKIATSVLTNLLNYHNDMDSKDMIVEALQTTGALNIYCNDNIVVKEIPFMNK